MVDAPPQAITSTIWQAVFADPVHGKEIVEQAFRSHPTLNYFMNGEIQAIKGWMGNNPGKAPTVKNGYAPKHIYYEATSAIRRDMTVAGMATTAAIAVAAAIETSVDSALPTNPFRTLSGDYGVMEGHVTWGLEEEVVRGGSGPKNLHRWLPEIKKDLSQQLSNLLNTGLWSDGGTYKIDGFAYWRKTTGTKWGSLDLATDTFLQGQSGTCTWAEFTYAKFIEWVDQVRLGAIGGTNSDGHKPNVAIVTTALMRKIKGWLYDKGSIIINQDVKGNDFVTLGTPLDYVMVDGICLFADDHLDDLMSTNAGLMYLFNSADWEVIFHKAFNFGAVDAYKEGGKAAADYEPYTIPKYVYKHGAKKIVLVNFFHKRPRNFGYFTITA